MADYVVKLSGQDNLTPTINNVKNALNGVSSTATGLDKIQEKFNKIQNSSAPLQRKLKDIKNLMAQLNLSGDSNSPIYNQMAQAAGNYADAIGDARNATNRFASDTMNLEAGISALQGIAAAGSIATGVMGLFGTKNEEVERAILKVQSAIAILNGVQSIANILNKDSVLIQKLKQIRIAASTTATVGETTAITANTVAGKLNTAGIVTNTVVTKAWNVVKAISKALLGDFTGLLIVGAGALATYAIATDNSTKSITNQTVAFDFAKKSQEEFRNKVASVVGDSISKFKALVVQWKMLQTTAEKTQFINDNKEAFKQLGFEVNNLTDAENIFVNNTNAVVQALQARAKAEAAQEALKDRWKKYYTEDREKKAHKAKSRDSQTKISDWGDSNEQAYISQRITEYMTKDQLKQFKKDGTIPKSLNDYMFKLSKDYVNEFVTNAYNETEEFGRRMEKELEAGLKEEKAIYDKHGIKQSKGNKGNKSGSGSKGSSKSNKKDEKVKTELELYKEYESKAKNIQEQFNVGLLDEGKAKEAIENVNKEVTSKFGNNAKQFKLEIKPVVEEGSLTKLDEEIKKLEDEKIRINPELNPERLAEINKQLDEYNNRKIELQFTLSGENKNSSNGIDHQIRNLEDKIAKIDIHTNYDDFLKFKSELNALKEKKHIIDIEMSDNPVMSLYDDIRNKISEIQSQYDAGLIDLPTAKKKVDEYNEELQKLGAKPIRLEFQSNFDTVMTSINEGLNDIQNIEGIINSFQNLSRSIEEGADAFTIFNNVMGIFTSIIGGVQTAMETYNTLSGIFTAKKTAEGVAAVTASSQIVAGETLKATADTASIAPATAATVAAKTQEAALLDLAAAEIFAAHASIPFAGVGLATGFITAMMSAMAAQAGASQALAAFADGGVVAGSSMVGDHLLARVNSGEMILNGKQQTNLFKAIDENRLGNNSLSGKVEFEIDGGKLKGVLNNHNSKIKKIR